MKHKCLAKRQFGIAVLSILFVCAIAVLVSSSRTAWATPSSNFVSTVLAQVLFEEIDVKSRSGGHGFVIKTNGLSDGYFTTVKVAPGGHSGWHTHPGPSLVAVKSGTSTFYNGDDPTCTPRIYPPGTGYVDEGGGHVHMVRNEGTVELELMVFQIIPVGAPRRIDVADPGTCSF
jgi:quercetin dioxygenase-like cupin family protein